MIIINCRVYVKNHHSGTDRPIRQIFVFPCVRNCRDKITHFKPRFRKKTFVWIHTYTYIYILYIIYVLTNKSKIKSNIFIWTYSDFQKSFKCLSVKRVFPHFIAGVSALPKYSCESYANGTFTGSCPPRTYVFIYLQVCANFF